MERISQILLRHQSRGLTLLYDIMPEAACHDAAADLLRLSKGTILIVTGFCCFGQGETDGPVGSHFLALALKRLGFNPIVVTDKYSLNYFINSLYPVTLFQEKAYAQRMMNMEKPVAMISIERCGRSRDGKYYNMHRKEITGITPSIDELFMIRPEGCLTIGIGDGGNEIGMGNYHDTLMAAGEIIPSCVKTDHCIIATVSNWGAYGLMAALEQLAGMPLLPDSEDVKAFLQKIVAMGATDGILGPGHCSTDGFDISTDAGILEALRELKPEKI